MKKRVLQEGQGDRLFLVFNGWGASPQSFDTVCFPKDADVWLFYDYSTLSVDLPDIHHKEIHLVAWSLGVWVATFLFQTPGLFVSATAINGTPYPINDQWGIPENIFVGTLQNMNTVGFLKFDRRMCGGGGKTLQKYLELEAVSNLERMKGLVELYNDISATEMPMESVTSLWNRAIISTSDNIFPTANMLNFWKNVAGVEVEEVDAPHMPFFSEKFQNGPWGI